MALTGTLESFQLGSLLQLLSNDQKTGVLHVSDDMNQVRIFIQKGTIVYASSTKPEHQLGRLLISEDILTESGLKKCLRLAKEKGQKVGKTLMEEGYISLETMKQILQHQVKEILCSLFFWKTGRFEFRDEPIQIDGKLVSRMNTLEIVLEATRRIDEWSFIKGEIPNDQLIFKISEKTQQKSDVNLNKEEWRILSLIEGTRTVKDLISKSGATEYEALKSLCSLHLAGLIEHAEGETGDASCEEIDYATVINIYNDIFKVIQQGMESEVGNSVYTMFSESKAQLLPDQQVLFQAFGLDKEPGDNTKAILVETERFYDLEKGRSFLAHSFTTLLQLFLEKGKSILGVNLTQKILEEILQTLSYIGEYHKKTPEMERILISIQSVVEKTGNTSSEVKRKTGGLLGLFKEN